MEIAQLEYLPARQASAQDFTANTIGMFVGAAPVVMTRHVVRRVRQLHGWHRRRTAPSIVEPLVDVLPDRVPAPAPGP